MAIRTTAEIMEGIRTRIGDSTEDADLTFIEDVNDTLQSMSEGESWRQKYEENDKAWRQRYRDRFFGTNADDPEPDPEPEVQKKKYTFDNLFKKE